MKLNQEAESIIKRIEYATLATADLNGHPWNTPVYCAYDKNYNFYWGSHKGSQHSKSIQHNKQVFLAIYNSTVLPGTGSGVYIQAEYMELTQEDEITFAHRLIQDRRFPIPYWKREQFSASGPIRLYKATPQRFWINGEDHIDGTYIDTRIEAEEA